MTLEKMVIEYCGKYLDGGDEIISYLGIPRELFGQYIWGQKAIPPEIYEKFAAFFSCSVDDVIGHTPQDRLCYLRLQQGLSQKELAAKAGVSARVIGFVEKSGNVLPTPADQIKLARALNCSVDYLMGKTTKRGTPPQPQPTPRGHIFMQHGEEAISVGEIVRKAQMLSGKRGVHVTIYPSDRSVYFKGGGLEGVFGY